MKKRAIILIAIVAVLGGGAYSYLRGEPSTTGAESTRTANVGAARSASSTDTLVAEITATIYQIERLQLDPSIFNSAAFHLLQDRTQVIPPEVPGRENPFAPLYSDRATSSARAPRAGTGGGLLGGSAAPGATSTAPRLPAR